MKGYAPSYRSLIDDTEWDKYGVGKNPRCDNCMAHCGFEGTAVNDAFSNPLKALKVWMRGPRVTGPDGARPARQVRRRCAILPPSPRSRSARSSARAGRAREPRVRRRIERVNDAADRRRPAGRVLSARRLRRATRILAPAHGTSAGGTSSRDRQACLPACTRPCATACWAAASASGRHCCSPPRARWGCRRTRLRRRHAPSNWCMSTHWCTTICRPWMTTIMRRGRPTCHKAFDEATALLVGDASAAAGISIAGRRSGAAAVHRRSGLRLIDMLAHAIGTFGMAGGQAIDLAVAGEAARHRSGGRHARAQDRSGDSRQRADGCRMRAVRWSRVCMPR